MWLPCLLEEEIQGLLDRKIPPLSISIDKRIQPLPNPEGEGFICALFDIKDNKCKIYKFRPDTCYFYPIQGSVDAIINDKPNRQMRIKIKCLSSLNVARKIITKALSEENGILLPNLTIIPLEV